MDAYLANNIWVLTASVLVFIMQAGFACCESGFARSKNASNIWLKNFCDFAIGALVFYLIGFGFMYGDDWNGLIGINGFLNPLDQDLEVWAGMEGSLDPRIYLLFQTMFCATTATIISGAVAERFEFKSYLIVIVFMTAFVYPVIGHWTWGGGWLSQIGFVDFAGSGIVHGCGGVAALVGCILVGPRIGKYSADGKSHAIPGHNIPMGVLGGFLLFVGWYGFNPGSELGFDDVTMYTTITTTLAASGGTLAAMFTSWIAFKKPDPTMAVNGCLCGLVAICTGVAEVSYVGAILIGIIAGLLVVGSIYFLDHKCHVDDPTGAISIHGAGGIWGMISGGLFSQVSGLFYGFGIAHLGIQILGAICIIAFTAVICFIIFSVLKHTIGIRVPKEVELEGLDSHEHNMVAYNI